ncbi:hypothetical protein [Chitinimonas koreensis]|uniref:hypothetical protein n=1 Tax=Chitinimonas koreensis TaxID=356302 RepID=UPI0005540AD1|nr:hypothetical protein [Chitinimonas koreensis]QNM94754.1 hypothetical protein H9L41_12465 [Chitinimonas koreensis]
MRTLVLLAALLSAGALAAEPAKHGCTQPPMLKEGAKKAEADAFNASYKAYGDCINDFIAAQNAIIDAQSAIAEQAKATARAAIATGKAAIEVGGAAKAELDAYNAQFEALHKKK